MSVTGVYPSTKGMRPGVVLPGAPIPVLGDIKINTEFGPTRQAVAQAILAERERCARIADEMGSITNFASPAFDEACRKIAAKIRSGE